MTARQEQPETECPKCSGPIDWKVVRDALGSPMYNGLCRKCNIVMRNREAPDITRGKTLEKSGEVGGIPVEDLGALDRRFTRLPGNVQLGILRRRQRRRDSQGNP